MIKVTCGIIKRGNKYFMAQRPIAKQMGGYWEFPGGKVEENEFESDCLHREWMEELGVRIIILKELMPITYDYTKFQIELYPFIIELLEGEIELKEHWSSGYFTKEEALKLDLVPADREIILKYLD